MPILESSRSFLGFLKVPPATKEEWPEDATSRVLVLTVPAGLPVLHYKMVHPPKEMIEAIMSGEVIRVLRVLLVISPKVLEPIALKSLVQRNGGLGAMAAMATRFLVIHRVEVRFRELKSLVLFKIPRVIELT